MTEAPFKVGDRVRMKFAARKGSQMKSFEGTVKEVKRYDDFYSDGTPLRGWDVWIIRSGLAPKTCPRFYVWIEDGHDSKWELSPLEDWTADQLLRTLAQAILDGDEATGDMMCDHYLELRGGTSRATT